MRHWKVQGALAWTYSFELQVYYYSGKGKKKADWFLFFVFLCFFFTRKAEFILVDRDWTWQHKKTLDLNNYLGIKQCNKIKTTVDFGDYSENHSFHKGPVVLKAVTSLCLLPFCVWKHSPPSLCRRLFSSIRWENWAKKKTFRKWQSFWYYMSIEVAIFSIKVDHVLSRLWGQVRRWN